jgi:hypothetical protein
MQMRNAEEVGLPRWPSKGNRRKLEALWLEELERHGLSVFLPEAPVDVPPELCKAIGEFNAGLFWECHETLESVWLSTPYPLRFFYHAIIKAAVGFYHLSRHNRHGARVKLADAVRLLRLFPPGYLGVRTDLLCRDTSAWLAKLEGGDAISWAELDDLARPCIR